MFKAILFDCYGTLIDFPTPRFIETLAQTCRNQGIEVDRDQFWEKWLEAGKAMSAVPYPEMSAEGTGKRSTYLIAGPPPHYRPYRDEWAEQFHRAYEALGLKGDGRRAYEELRLALSEAPTYPEVHETLARLDGQVRMAILSNADDDFIYPCLERNGIRLDPVVTSEGVKSYKPWPDIFWITAEKLQLPVTDILYVGDSPVADVLGARSAGMPVAWLNRRDGDLPEHIPPPDYEIASLTDLVPLLQADTVAS